MLRRMGRRWLVPDRGQPSLLPSSEFKKKILNVPSETRTVQIVSELSSPKPTHTMGRSRRGPRRDGGAGSGRTVCQRKCSPMDQSFLVFPKASKTRGLNVSPDTRTSEILWKPDGGTKPADGNRFFRGLSAVFHRHEKRSFLLAATQWKDAFLFLQTFFMQGMSRKPTEEQNPRLATGSSAVDPRFISRTKSALRSWLLTSVLTPICF